MEDEVVVTTYLAAFFTRTGYEVATAQNMASAEELLNRITPDIVLLDLVLGDEDGLDLLDRIKKDRPQVPVVIVTGVTPDDSIIADCQGRGAAGYVTKESTVDHLLMVVRRVLGE